MQARCKSRAGPTAGAAQERVRTTQLLPDLCVHAEQLRNQLRAHRVLMRAVLHSWPVNRKVYKRMKL